MPSLRKKLSWMMFVILIFSFLTMQGVNMGEVQTLPKVFVDPSVINDEALRPGAVSRNSYPSTHAYNASVTNPTYAYDKDQTTAASINFAGNPLPPGFTYFEVANFNSTFVQPYVALEMKMNYSVTLSNSQYRILLCVGSVSTTLQTWTSAQQATPSVKTWTGIPEPNDGDWNQTDLTNLRIRIETKRSTPAPPAPSGTFKIYELWVSILGDSFKVKINITNVENLYGWQINMTFNPAVLNTTIASIIEGPFLQKAGATILLKTVDNSAGVLLVSCSFNPPYPPSGASGNGTLVYITFKVRAAERGTLLQFVRGTKLNKVVADTLVPIEHTTKDGIFDNRTGNMPPVASFSVEPSVANVNDTIKFDASASYDPDAWLVSYRWDFGDGTTKLFMREELQDINLTAKATHSYIHGGLYTVTLTVTDNDGETATAKASVTIQGHDVAVTNVKSIYISAMQGVLVPVNVTVANNGDFTETFNVTAYYNETAIETQKVIEMPPHTEKPLTFTWNTTSVDFDRYLLKANATIVEDDYDPSNNEYIDGTVAVALTNIVDYPVVVGGFTFHVIVESNSTPSNYLQFSSAEKKIGFNVEGKTDTPAFCNVTIPVDLLGGPYTVLLNDTLISPKPKETTNGTHTSLHFTYTHSLHNVLQIRGKTVAMPPIAIFTMSTKRAIARTLVTFNATDSYARVPYGTIANYTWNFDDGNTTWLTDPIIKHAYTTAGNYTVTLTVKDNKQLTNSTQAQITVIDYPTADFSHLPTTPLVGENVTFNASASEPNGGSIINYSWEFGDGGTDTGVIATHSYSATEDYTVTLTVTDSEDLTNTKETTITVIDYPIAEFSYTPDAPLVNQTITFDATASKQNGGTIIDYAWEFGDDQTGTGVIATHSYSATGNYTVILTITDSEDLTNITTKIVTVKLHNIAITSLTASPNTVKIGESVIIEVTVVNNGNFTENFTVTAYYNNTAIERKTVTDLTSGGSQLLTIVWDTEDVSPDVYIVKAEASNVTGETKTDDNMRVDGTVTVQKMNSTLSINASSTTLTVDETTTISGTLDPVRQAVSVTIQYRLVGGTWSTLHTVATDTEGRYTHDWTPENPGTYEVKASWQGDATTQPSESIVLTIIVQEAQTPITFLYVAGVAVIIILIVILTYFFLRIRKPKTP